MTHVSPQGPHDSARQRQRTLFEADGPGGEVLPWEEAHQQDVLVAEVVFNRPLTTTFDYVVPAHLRPHIQPGQRVRVPFGAGNRLTVGYCVGLRHAGRTDRPLKPVREVLDPRPMLSPAMLELTRWMAERYLCGWGQVLDCVLPAAVKRRVGTRMVNVFRPTDAARKSADQLEGLTPKQRSVLEQLLRADRPLSADEVCRRAGCGPGPLRALKEKGLVVQQRAEVDRLSDRSLEPLPQQPNLKLNADQQKALDAILQAVRSGRHQTFLLHGVTGSGKTEVYIQAIQEVVSYGRQAIVLVPEISLTPQTIHRFRQRFRSVAVLHSHLSDAERRSHWERIARGEVQVVVGARSAVFAPVPHLGLIVIDEEHETTFKQETTPRYHAREVAERRAEMAGVPLVLGSATPTLESWWRAKQGAYTLLRLPHRVERRPLPPVTLVDIRHDPFCRRGAAIGRALNVAIRQALEEGGQVILFLNVRGYSPAVWCRACGRGVRCPDCDITLTWHRDRNAVVCHFCDYHGPPLEKCPECGHPGLRYLGIGTQKLEEEVRARFPEHKCVRMDSDAMRQHGSHDRVLQAFQRGEVHILLGTQMIAKGLDIPNVTLVGVVDADTLLHQPDLRAAERTFQLLAQVAGRTGRGPRGGRVVVQSACPTEPAVQLAVRQDYERFAEWELKNRQEAEAPPFCHLARVIVRGLDEQRVQKTALEIGSKLQSAVEQEQLPVTLLGPAPAPVYRQKKHYRYHLLLKAATPELLAKVWHSASPLPRDSHVEYTIDVDPVSLR